MGTVGLKSSHKALLLTRVVSFAEKGKTALEPARSGVDLAHQGFRVFFVPWPKVFEKHCDVSRTAAADELGGEVRV